MLMTSSDLQTLAADAAQSVGFPDGHAQTFGRAAVRHLAAGRDPEALVAALRSTNNSPILRLAMLGDNILAACGAMKGPAELTLLASDVDVALSYAELVPFRLTLAEIVERDEQPRLRVSIDFAQPDKSVPPSETDVPEDLQGQLVEIARTSRPGGSDEHGARREVSKIV